MAEIRVARMKRPWWIGDIGVAIGGDNYGCESLLRLTVVAARPRFLGINDIDLNLDLTKRLHHHDCRVVATSAARKAADRRDFLDMEEVGMSVVELLSGEDELQVGKVLGRCFSAAFDASRHGDESDIGGLSSGAQWLVTGEAGAVLFGGKEAKPLSVDHKLCRSRTYNARRNVVTVPMTKYSTFPHSKASEVKTLESMETSPVNKFPPAVIAKATEFAAMPEATFCNTELDRGTFDVC